MGIGKILDWIAKGFVAFIFTFMFINIFSLLISEKMNLFAIESPLIFAFLIACAMLICFTIIMYKDHLPGKRERNPEERTSEGPLSELLSVILYAAGIFAYSMLVKQMHFVAGSVIFLTIGMFLMNAGKAKRVEKIGKALVASIVTVPVLYYVFFGVFNVMLP